MKFQMGAGKRLKTRHGSSKSAEFNMKALALNRWNPAVVFFLLALSLGCSADSQVGEQTARSLRADMIGLDTSHAPAFAQFFNNPKATGDIAGIRVVADYHGGTDLPANHPFLSRLA